MVGGRHNTASNFGATVVGGDHNTASGKFSFVGRHRAMSPNFENLQNLCRVYTNDSSFIPFPLFCRVQRGNTEVHRCCMGVTLCAPAHVLSAHVTARQADSGP